MRRVWFVVALGLLNPLQSVQAQDYPARVVTMVVPFAAGGPVDNIGRAFADAMRRQLGQSVVIDNKPGGGGLVGTRHVTTAKSDGYTLLVGSAGPLVIAPATGAAAVDVERQLRPVGLIAESPQILVTGAPSGITTLADFIAAAKGKPGAMHFASAGLGTTPHLAGELLKAQAGIDLVHVPYRGTGAALPDLLSGRIECLFGDISSVLPLIQAGRVKALAIASPKRSPLAPEIVTTAEAGLPKMLSRNWQALMGPAALSAPVVEKLASAMTAAMSDQVYLEALRKQGAAPVASSPGHLAEYLKADRETLTPIIKAIGLKLE